MTHPQLMHRLLSCGNELTVHVVPLTNTSIKEGEPRRNIGKPLRKKARKPQPSIGKGAPSKQARSKNSSLLRRLSGKRGTGDIIPGTANNTNNVVFNSSFLLQAAPPRNKLLCPGRCPVKKVFWWLPLRLVANNSHNKASSRVNSLVRRPRKVPSFNSSSRHFLPWATADHPIWLLPAPKNNKPTTRRQQQTLVLRGSGFQSPLHRFCLTPFDESFKGFNWADWVDNDYQYPTSLCISSLFF